MLNHITKHSFFYFILFMYLITPSTHAKETILDKVSSTIHGAFKSNPCEQTITKEIPMSKAGTLCVKNLDGDITIQSEQKKKSVVIKAIKHTRTPELLSGIDIDIHATDEKSPIIHVATRRTDLKVRGSVDYTIIVPAKTKLQLHTDQGIITVNESHGTIDAHTIMGDIAIHHSTKTITAQSEKKGNILIHNARGSIRVSAHIGDINLNETSNSILAKVEKGKINSSCLEIPYNARLSFNADRGNITLGLPKTVNATILGKSETGTVTSDHFITLKPQTMQLNMMAWNKIKHEIHGTLGTGEADIQLHNRHGNIKIINTSSSIVA